MCVCLWAPTCKLSNAPQMSKANLDAIPERAHPPLLGRGRKKKGREKLLLLLLLQPACEVRGFGGAAYLRTPGSAGAEVTVGAAGPGIACE